MQSTFIPILDKGRPIVLVPRKLDVGPLDLLRRGLPRREDLVNGRSRRGFRILILNRNE